jgi:hypothetical protein
MAERIHIVLSRSEKERYRQMAAREGKTLSEWLRAAADERAAKAAPGKLDSDEALRAFFAECDAREAGRGPEPDWEEHKKNIERSMSSGATDT